MAGGLSYPTGRDMPPGMQAMVAGNWIREVQRILKESFCEIDGIQHFCTSWVPLPEAVVIEELNGTGVVVHDSKGQKWRDGKIWIDG